MNEKMNSALDEISDQHINEAAQRRYWWFNHLLTAIEKAWHKRWVRRITIATAAVLTLALLWDTVAFPVSLPIAAKAVSLADYSVSNAKYDRDYIEAATQGLQNFFTESMTQVLSDHNNQNRAFSPMSLYISLSALAEMTGGDQQIMSVLGASDLSELRRQTTALWNQCSVSYDRVKTTLATSLWIDNSLQYNQATMDTLAKEHYTSVYQRDLGGVLTNQDIRNWINGQTGGLLKDSANNVNLDPNTAFALFSTVFFKASWVQRFHASRNKFLTFHGAEEDVTLTFMCDRDYHYYYWGEDYGAIRLEALGGNGMWLILPDEDKTVDDVLASEEWAKMVTASQNWTQNKQVCANLKLPKFDIRDSNNLIQDLKAMGITDVFDPDRADFTAAFPKSQGLAYLSEYSQVTRVAIDEEGIYAASYTQSFGATGAPPTGDKIDFILDRPFLFVITTSNQIPLFAGIVNMP
ncbi:MAG: serpin family protein [Ruminococcaceae bacterium]|nr:serpin family protein [Oscillospiraceae bacterium]